MIVWRSNKAGYVGASKRLIKGAFQYTYSKSSDAVAVLSTARQNGPFLKNVGRFIG